VFAVGVGSKVERSELRTIASAPKCNRVFFLDAFAHIPSFASQILKDACKGELYSDRWLDISNVNKQKQFVGDKNTQK